MPVLKSLFTSLTVVALMLLTGIAGAAEKEPLRIAYIDPLSGPMAAVGTISYEQFKFDAARINKAGGINGHKIEIIGFDNKISPQESLVQLRKAMDAGIHYVAQANGSSVGSALLNAIAKHNQRSPDDRVLYLNFGAVDPAFTNQRCSFWHFRFDANATMKMNTLTSWIAKQKNIHKVFLINQDYSFGHSVSDDARQMLKEKRPDIEIVGNVFHPLAKVKDFTPYVSQIKASGADAVITGNWGQDITLLIKAAADYGLDIPFMTYYANSVGTISAVGDKGVGRVNLVWLWNGDYKDPQMAQRELTMYKQTGYDYGDLRATYTIEMLKKAAEKAGSIDPTKVAFALEGLQYEGPAGTAVMRAADHQIQVPMFISKMQDNMKYGAEGTPYNFHALHQFSAADGELPTTCHMRRPKKI